MKKGQFREIKHTADLGIEVRAGSIEELFTVAMDGYYFLALGETEFPAGQSAQTLSLQAYSMEELLVSFLNELNFYLMSKNIVVRSLKSFRLEQAKDNYQLTVGAETFSIDSQFITTEIKAVTYHQLKIVSGQNGFQTAIFFDI